MINCKRKAFLPKATVITMINKNDILQLSIIDVSSDGLGIGKFDGYVLFVPSAFVGDILEVKVVKTLKNYGFAIITDILTPSPDRIPSDCSVFGKCGGCSFRHISYSAECSMKEKWVRDAMERLGGITTPVSPILPSPTVDHYRNKAQFPAALAQDGSINFGFYSKRSHRLINSKEHCLLHPTVFSDIVSAVEDYCKASGITVYDEARHSGLLRHLFIRYGEATGEIMVCLVINGKDIPREKLLVSRLTSAVPNIKSIVLNINTKKTNEILGPKCKVLWGSPYISDILCGNRLNISPLSFYQVNRSCTELLYNTAFDIAGLSEKDVLLDLYCGIGSIGLSAANRVKSVIGVEIVPDAIEDAKLNAAQNNISNARFICADAKVAAASLLNEGLSPDIIVIDPPRKGCDEQVLNSISSMAPDRILMISCNPSTAARDAKALSALGYCVTKIQPVDMFPRTTHVECVVQLCREV